MIGHENCLASVRARTSTPCTDVVIVGRESPLATKWLVEDSTQSTIANMTDFLHEPTTCLPRKSLGQLCCQPRKNSIMCYFDTSTLPNAYTCAHLFRTTCLVNVPSGFQGFYSSSLFNIRDYSPIHSILSSFDVAISILPYMCTT